MEEFKPLEPGIVRWYNCGPTVYDLMHLGHARSLVAFDTIRRYLEFCGYTVRYVQNFTDIDDKMIQRAHQEGRSIIEVAEDNIRYYYRDVDRLNVKRATIHPRAMLHIPHMISMIQKLIEKGYAYESNGDVYFDVRKFANYGKLSGHKLEHIAHETEDAENPNKRFPADFVLWKSKKEGEPSWYSPWGEGRPGWHIECSVMSMTYLGDTIDIHSGGQDLIFPHHENEIAQSEALTGKPFVRYWLHNGYLNINSEKMSKSLGNFITLERLLEQYSGDVIRLYLLMTHYRQPINFTKEGINQAKVTAERLLNIILLTKMYSKEVTEVSELSDLDKQLLNDIDRAKKVFMESMNEDFNTSNALAAVFSLSKQLNTYIRKVDIVNPEVMKKANAFFDDIRNILGLFENLDQYAKLDIITKLVKLLIELRQEFRKNKNWAMSDKIRDFLTEAGITLEDTPKRVLWKLTKIN